MSAGDVYLARICWANPPATWSNTFSYRQQSATVGSAEGSLRAALIQPGGLNEALRDLVGASTKWVKTYIRRTDPPNYLTRQWDENLPSFPNPIAPTAPIDLALRLELLASSPTRQLRSIKHFSGLNATHFLDGVADLVPQDLPQSLAFALVAPLIDGFTVWQPVCFDLSSGGWFDVTDALFRCDLVPRRRPRTDICGLATEPVS